MKLSKVKFNRMSARLTLGLLAALLLGAGILGAADDAAPTAVTPPSNTAATDSQSQSQELALLRAAVAAQQKQLEALQRTIEHQQQILESLESANSPPTPRPNLGKVASLAPIVPSGALAVPTA